MTPTKHPALHSTPRDVFLHLLGTLTLFISVISVLTVIFQYINLLYPDPLNFFRQGVLETIRGASSALIVGFPLFLWISSILHTDLVADPAKRELGIRKWLIYFTLLVAAVTMIAYLITLVGGLYGGELSLSFGLKTVAVFAITGLVFGYYLWDVRQVGAPGVLPKQLAAGTGIFVVALLVAGLFIAGTPAEQRRFRFDAQRVNDLQAIQAEIVQYWTSKAALPATMTELRDSISGFVAPTDPETKVEYGYRVLGEHTFELCATFATVSDPRDALSETTYAAKPVVYDAAGRPLVSDVEGSWQHGVGRTCFERTIDPERYRPQTTVPTS